MVPLSHQKNSSLISHILSSYFPDCFRFFIVALLKHCIQLISLLSLFALDSFFPCAIYLFMFICPVELPVLWSLLTPSLWRWGTCLLRFPPCRQTQSSDFQPSSSRGTHTPLTEILQHTKNSLFWQSDKNGYNFNFFTKKK